jgi:ubiquinone/menaquinone biosynthesis C-methylase UbiE
MTLADVRSTFDEWAPFYNPTHSWIPGAGGPFTLTVRPGDRVLDLACGTGLNFSHLRALVGETGRVVGVDLSPRMLEVADRLIASRGWKNVEVREADAAHLPFPEASFDRAICSFALNIIPDYRRAIQDIRRVLVPSGRFVSLEIRPAAHGLPWLWRVCTVDMSHDTLGGLQDAFGDVTVWPNGLGLIVITVADK